MTESRFYSDRTTPKPPGTLEELPIGLWNALVHLTNSRLSGNWFAEQFPEQCPDARGVCATNTSGFEGMLEGLIPNLSLPLQTVSADPDPWVPNTASRPSTDTALDLVDFLVRYSSEPIQDGYHSYFGHYELRFDREAGRESVRDDINELFQRNRVAYEIGADFRTRRTVPIEGSSVVAALVQPRTGDPTLDRLLAGAIDRFQSAKQEDRKLGLDKIFDAFERLKTIDATAGAPTNKKSLIKTLLDQVAPQTDHQRWRGHLDQEFDQLTSIGNSMHIRHAEVGQEPLDPKAVDYLFIRTASAILYVLRESDHLT